MPLVPADMARLQCLVITGGHSVSFLANYSTTPQLCGEHGAKKVECSNVTSYLLHVVGVLGLVATL